MADLSLECIGLKFKNPFLIASGQHTTSMGLIRKNAGEIANAGWAGLVTKTFVLEGHPLSTLPITHIFPISGLRRSNMQNIGPSQPILSQSVLREDVKAAKDAGLIIIASVMGRTLDEWTVLARSVEECGADAVELSIGCPVILDARDISAGVISHSPDLVNKVVRAAKKECSAPIIPKVTPNLREGDLPIVTKAAENAGADAISAINTVLGLAGIDIETGIPLSSDIYGKSIISGISGPIVKPIGLQCVSQIAKAVDIPVFGIGGISDYKSAIEYMMVGASVVQLCTAVMFRGYQIGRDLTKGLSEFMKRKGYKSLDDFRGISLPNIITNHLKMNLKTKVSAFVNEQKCTGCGLCVTACSDGATNAITMEDKIAVVNKDVCIGCGLCRVICLVNAIDLAALT